MTGVALLAFLVALIAPDTTATTISAGTTPSPSSQTRTDTPSHPGRRARAPPLHPPRRHPDTGDRRHRPIRPTVPSLQPPAPHPTSTSAPSPVPHPEIHRPSTWKSAVRQQGENPSAHTKIKLSVDTRLPRGAERDRAIVPDEPAVLLDTLDTHHQERSGRGVIGCSP